MLSALYFRRIPLQFSLIELRLILTRNNKLLSFTQIPGFASFRRLKIVTFVDWGSCEHQDCYCFVCCASRWNTVYPARRRRSCFSSVFEAGHSEPYTRLRSYSSRRRVFFPSIPLVPGTHDYIRALPHCNSYQKIRGTQLRHSCTMLRVANENTTLYRPSKFFHSIGDSSQQTNNTVGNGRIKPKVNNGRDGCYYEKRPTRVSIARNKHSCNDS